MEIPEINAIDNTLQLYNERWSHYGNQHVRALLRRNTCCEPCIYSKAHRLLFDQKEKSTAPGELLSAEVRCLFAESFTKKKYLRLVIFKDSYTKFRYGCLVREKSEAKDKLREMLQHTKTLGHPIKEILSDNGDEFDNQEMREILSNAGVIQTLTTLYTP
ncbi:hypothetical protein ILUMI_20139 [Ignelater luminosus]|uniref:Integrase catalytic domain-containing protein n=1 Tax=Ignelater luminosus TaxID=2038154 RepID=A0A8K0G4U5_IGNLU|nr:hypothetical protein ILUMI_20139 [Ignelater luminosus]